MNLEKLLEIEARQEFDDVNAIRSSRIRSFLDEWIVTGLLGRGSFGNVYQITKPQDGMTAQRCALKICQVNNAEDAEIRRQEIETQRLLNGHPNAVQIEDYALISREPPRVSYLLIRMELLSPMPSYGLDEREAIRLGIDICSVLEKCSSLEPKLVHCDIKPANILVAEDGRYKLGDFGTAKTLQATMTYTGNRGTPLYMAPEVASYTGYDSRCDIFSLGYTMLTMLNEGKHPYQNAGDRSEILREMYESKKLPQIKGVSSGLMKIVRKMCDPNLNSRYSRASEVRRDLELYVRKKEEAERAARLEAERQAEIAKQKAKAERTRNIKLADHAVEKAGSELSAARSALETMSGEEKRSTKKKIKLLEANAERAVRAHSYVMGGDTFDAAVRKVREEDTAVTRQKRTEFIKENRVVWIGGAAVWAVLVAAFACILYILPGNGIGKSGSQTDSGSLTFELVDGGYALCGYTGDPQIVDVPSRYNGKPVVEIANNAFNGCSTLTEINIPKGVKSIGNYAFKGCTSMTDIIIPNSVESIGNYAFYNCLSLLEINIPDSITSIGDRAFQFCNSLTSINISGNITSIGVQMFSNCSSLVELNMPDSVTKIGDYAFNGCSSLEQIDLSENLTSIWFNAFRDCTSLTEIVIPDNVSYIGEYAFFNCTSLTEINLSDSLTFIGNHAFQSCTSLSEIDIPDGVTSIEDGTFADCRSLTDVELPGNINRIGADAFTACRLLTYIKIPDSVTDIGIGAFSYCESLTEIDIPTDVLIIGESVFRNCTSLSRIVLPDSITSIGKFAFASCKSLTNINIPESVSAIDLYAFIDCFSLTITAPNSQDYYALDSYHGNYPGIKEWIVE